MIELGKKAKKIKKKAKRKIREVTHPPEYAMAPAAPPPAELPPSAVIDPPRYPESARAVQATPKKQRKKRSAVKKRTVREMHVEINRRVAAVGVHGMQMSDPDIPDQQKFITLTRQTGNIGDTLAGQNAAPELVHRELIRVMALAALWAQSLPKRGT